MRQILTDLYRMTVCMAALFAVSVLLAGAPPLAYALDKADLQTVKAAESKGDDTVILTRGMAEIVDVPGPIADIMVANPSIVDVTALQSNKLYLVGVAYGTTNVIAVDAEGNVVARMNVHVKIDDVVIQKTIDELYPNEKVKITSTADQVILTGHVSTPDASQKIADIVGSYIGEINDNSGTADEMIVNMLTVAGEQQVMLRVKVVEASRDVLRELGVEADYIQSANDPTGFLTTQAAAGLTADPLGVASIVRDAGGTGFGAMQLIIRALEEDGLINTLAEPNLTAISGEQAGFLAGGEFPVPTARDQDGNIVVTYRPFGVALNFRPVVLSDDRISLQLQTEVSSISNQNSYSINELIIPGFSVRRAETTVEIGSGGSLMIAGLLQSDVTKTLTQLPGIENIPVLGNLMKSDSFQRQESELVVIVTAYLVKPYSDPESASTQAPEQEGNPLAQMFAKNIKRAYSKLKLDADLFAQNEKFGYLLE